MTVDSTESIKNINRFPAAAGAIRVLLDKHFSQDCRERRELLETCELFDLLWEYHTSLEHTHKILEEMRSTGAVPAAGSPHEFDVLSMTAHLNGLAKTLTNKDAKEIVWTASEFMQRWLLLESVLNRLMEQSSKLRVGLGGRRPFS